MTVGQEFAEFLRRYEERGQKFENLTPEQYAAQGIEGASYDAYGNIQFAPPGMDPEQAFAMMDQACTWYENLSLEGYMAMIEAALAEKHAGEVDPLESQLRDGGLNTHPELLDDLHKQVAESCQRLYALGATRDMETGEWTLPPDPETVARDEALRQAMAHSVAADATRPALQLIDDTEDDGCVARKVDHENFD